MEPQVRKSQSGYESQETDCDWGKDGPVSARTYEQTANVKSGGLPLTCLTLRPSLHRSAARTASSGSEFLAYTIVTLGRPPKTATIGGAKSVLCNLDYHGTRAFSASWPDCCRVRPWRVTQPAYWPILYLSQKR